MALMSLTTPPGLARDSHLQYEMMRIMVIVGGDAYSERLAPEVHAYRVECMSRVECTVE
jgi:hypothetical protein